MLVPGDGVAAAVLALGPLDDALAFGAAEGGSVALAAFRSARGPGRSVLRVSRADGEVPPVELSGEVLALAVTASGDDAFVVVRELDKKGAVRGAGLLRLDTRTGRAAPQLDLPVTARGIAFAADEAALLLAAKNEIRTFTLPGLTSGPLYRVPGDNVTIAAISGTSRVLVTQGARIVLVDLASPQDREGLPVVASADAATAVRALVSAPAEPRAIALLEGGSTLLIETEPLGVTPGSSAVAIAWPGTKAGPTPPAAAAAAAVTAATTPPPEPPPSEPVAPAPPPEAIQDSVETGPDPAPVPPPVVPVEPPPAEAPPAAPPSVENPDLPEGVSGRVSGPARADARSIVFLGPDNVLKEAARVAIDATGAYVVSGLRPGSYRVVATGEGGRVLACQPAFVTVIVDGSGRQAVPTLEVVRAY
jgi:hypothetical protein